MTDAREQVAWLRSAMPYINNHRGKTFVIALDGDLFRSENFHDAIEDIGLLSCLGVRLVIVYGTRPKIDAYLQQKKHSVDILGAYRVTDEKALAAAKTAAGDGRIEIESMLSSGLYQSPLAGANLRVSSGNFITARPLGVLNGVDYQYTGTVRKVDHTSIGGLLDLGNVVLVSPLGYSPTGEVFSLCHGELAAQVAISMQADKLIYITNQQPIKDATPITEMTCTEAEQVAPAQSAAVQVSIANSIEAVRNGIKRAHLVPYLDSGSLLLELFTRDGYGTLITSQSYEQLHAATVDDVAGILALIRPLEQDGSLVKRSREKLEAEIGRFIVIKRDQAIIGCAAFYPYVDDRLAEVACVAVNPECRNNFRGEKLLETIEKHARGLGINRLFVLTTQSAHWFQEKGFVAGNCDDLPMAKQQLYNFQRNSKVFFKPL